jgi:hypothetical protein
VKATAVRALKPNLIALVIFVACFALHIVAGQLDFDLLFAAAVVLIWASAAGFPLLVHVVSGGHAGSLGMGLALIVGVGLTAATLRATRDSGFEVLDLAAGAAIVLAVNGAAYLLHERRQRATVRPA